MTALVSRLNRCNTVAHEAPTLLAAAMKKNPTMKVMVNGGYFDVSAF